MIGPCAQLVEVNSQLFPPLSIYDYAFNILIEIADKEKLMDKQFASKTLLVTGATSGIGKATALRFAEAGANVAAVGRNETALTELRDELAGRATQCVTIQVDLAEPKSANAAVTKTIEQFGGIDVLVNAAGHISSGTIEATSLEAWDAMLNINLRYVFVLMQRALPSLISRRGNIVNVSSVTGLRAFPGVLAYCVSKAGLDQLTRCAALELASKGVRVNAVNPGVVQSNLHRSSGMNEEEYAKFLEVSKTT